MAQHQTHTFYNVLFTLLFYFFLLYSFTLDCPRDNPRIKAGRSFKLFGDFLSSFVFGGMFICRLSQKSPVPLFVKSAYRFPRFLFAYFIIYFGKRKKPAEQDFSILSGLSIADDYSSLTSGRPATEVSRDRMPARADALATITQFTSPNTALVPMVATAVCATVFSALMPAAFSHCLKFVFILFSPFRLFVHRSLSHVRCIRSSRALC